MVLQDHNPGFRLGSPDSQKLPFDSRTALFILLGIVGVVLIAVIVVLSLPGSGPASSSRLSESTQRKIFYDIIATQDLDPDSNEWNEGVKQAAADYYNVPMSTSSEIIARGATEHWLQPSPP